MRGAVRACRGAVLLLATAMLAACAGPSRTDEDYRLKAANTAQAAVSELRTAALAVDAASRHRATGPYLSVVLGETETNLDSIAALFSGVQPPDEPSDRLHDRLDAMLADGEDLLRALRIAVRRGELDRLAEIGAPLEGLAASLETFEQEQP